MIWHFYGNNERVIMTDNPYQQQCQLPVTSASMSSVETNADKDDDEYWLENERAISKKPYIASNTRSLFLSFNSDLCLQKTRKKKAPTATKSTATATTNKQPATIKVNGMNILNRKNLDSKTVAERIQKRRENHNSIERHRRDCINDTIYKLSQTIPNASTTTVRQPKLNKHRVLKSALDHILQLQSENASIKKKLLLFQSPVKSVSSCVDGSTSHHGQYALPDLHGRSTIGMHPLQQEPTENQYSYHHLSEFKTRNWFHVP